MCLFTFGLLAKTLSMVVAYFSALFRHLLRKAAISTIRKVSGLTVKPGTILIRGGCVKYRRPTFAKSVNKFLWPVNCLNMSDRNNSNIIAVSDIRQLQ